jgi:glycosyltransferase involved in cell wall biosynthesis
MKRRKLNVLITAPSLDVTQNVSGISSVVLSIMTRNDQCVYHHYLLGRPDKKLNILSWLASLITQLLFFPLALKKNKTDLVHQNLPFDPKGILREFVINSWCRLLRVPVVLHIHGGVFLMNKTDNKIYRFLSQRMFKNSKGVIVLSEIEKGALSENYHYPSAFVLANGIDVAQFSEAGKKKQNKIPVFLFMGRLHESKGLEDILSAFKLLKEEADFEFVLCGDGPLKKKLVSECNFLLKNRFKYLGVVSGQNKIDIIRSADYFLLPSRYGEGLPIALLETMAAGLVPIVTDDASMKYVVENEKNGIFVEKRNPDDLYRKMKNLLSNPDLFNVLSANAGESVAEKYDIRNYIFQLNRIYEKCL